MQTGKIRYDIVRFLHTIFIRNVIQPFTLLFLLMENHVKIQQRNEREIIFFYYTICSVRFFLYLLGTADLTEPFPTKLERDMIERQLDRSVLLIFLFLSFRVLSVTTPEFPVLRNSQYILYFVILPISCFAIHLLQLAS